MAEGYSDSSFEVEPEASASFSAVSGAGIARRTHQLHYDVEQWTVLQVLFCERGYSLNTFAEIALTGSRMVALFGSR